ncbi:hypothetical protein [Martelella radicis]|uniref:Uncharacterized protein n=1 Tax=Martelella radicis TaxID=1397476 RepID=A0A7W6KIU5_9HYPH|nr:hypothetical protein [Martelella radicis]MBB4121800.1 hypothetical protein [Martelella radicis]
MKITDEELTRQDEDIPPADFAREEARHDRFGNWPEVAGLVFTLFVIWLTFAFTG